MNNFYTKVTISFLVSLLYSTAIFSQKAKIILQNGLSSPSREAPSKILTSSKGKIWGVLQYGASHSLQIRMISTNWLLREIDGVQDFFISTDKKIYYVKKSLHCISEENILQTEVFPGIEVDNNVDLVISPDNKLAVISLHEGSVSDFRMIIYDLANKKVIKEIYTYSGAEVKPKFSADSELLFFAKTKDKSGYYPSVYSLIEDKIICSGKYKLNSNDLFISEPEQSLYYNSEAGFVRLNYINKKESKPDKDKNHKYFFLDASKGVFLRETSSGENEGLIEIVENKLFSVENAFKREKHGWISGISETKNNLLFGISTNHDGLLINYDYASKTFSKTTVKRDNIKHISFAENEQKLYVHGIYDLYVYDFKTGVLTDSIKESINHRIDVNFFNTNKTLILNYINFFAACQNSVSVLQDGNVYFSKEPSYYSEDKMCYKKNGDLLTINDSAIQIFSINNQVTTILHRKWNTENHNLKDANLRNWSSDSICLIEVIQRERENLYTYIYIFLNLNNLTYQSVRFPQKVRLIQSFNNSRYTSFALDTCSVIYDFKHKTNTSISLDHSARHFSMDLIGNKILYEKTSWKRGGMYGNFYSTAMNYEFVDLNKELKFTKLVTEKSPPVEVTNIDGELYYQLDTTKYATMLWWTAKDISLIEGKDSLAVLKFENNRYEFELWNLTDSSRVLSCNLNWPYKAETWMEQRDRNIIIFSSSDDSLFIKLIPLTKGAPSNEIRLGINFEFHKWELTDELLFLQGFSYSTGYSWTFINLNSNEIVRLFPLDEKNIMTVNSDGYYMATSSDLKPQVIFELNNVYYSYDQFDLKYNRPDLVLKSMGCNNPDKQSMFYNAYLKRIKKMGFTPEMLNDDIHLPEIKIINRQALPSLSDSSELNLDIDIRDSKYKLDRANVYLNNVPVFGVNGIDLRNQNAKEIRQIIKLNLISGSNKVEISVLNQAGAESYKEAIYITYKPKVSVNPNLYLINIGDSKYKDKRFNLNYASKDAEDIKTTFNESSLYSKVFTYTFTNEQVTKENILKLREELKKAKRDDVVIISVAGHGVLDKDLNYYLATYDMDFNNPAEKGLPYQDLESLVDGIAPLKKVIFLDACHSGEIDKEEVEQLALANTNSGEVKFRAAGSGIQKKNLGLKSTSELMGELFTDLRRGTGATVISSAGGAEYALESDQWKNGLFTYCLLHGLKDKAADANRDGQIMLSELQQYLRTEVTKLSNGAQQPTSRIENLSVDFRVW